MKRLQVFLIRRIIILIFLIIIVKSVSGNMIINEIMYDFPGSDTNHEWIEIYNNGNESVNISGWKFYEDDTNHGLELKNGSFLINATSYAIIAEDAATFLLDYPTFNSTLIDSSFSLIHSEENISLKNKSLAIVETITYNPSWGANGNNKTLERINPSKNEWDESIDYGGTPGKLNSLYGTCDWKVSVSLKNNINFFEITNESITVDFKIALETDYNSSTNFSYWVEDSYKNIVKSKLNKNTSASWTSNYYQKTFDEAGGYIIFANITNTTCKDRNATNNIARMFVILQGNESIEGEENADNEIEEEKEEDSSIKITDADEETSFGSIINVKIDAYRGSTNKYALYAWVGEGNEMISEKTTAHLKTKYMGYKLTLPIQIKQNCDKKLDEGTYYVYIDGLGDRDSERIKINNKTSSLCKTEKVIIYKNATAYKTINSNSSKTKNEQAISNNFNNLKKFETVYESSNKKAEKLIPYLIVFITTLISVILIWRR